MFEFSLTMLLFMAVGAMLLVIARALPRVEEEPSAREPLLDRLLKSGAPERIDAAVNSMLEKFLRKARVLVLKTDNSIAALLKKVKPEMNGLTKQPTLDFSEILASTSEENTREEVGISSG